MDRPDPDQGMTVADALANARRLLANNPAAAIRQAREVARVEPSIAETQFILASALRRCGRDEEAGAAESEGLRISMADPVLRRVSENLSAGENEKAELLLRRFLNDSPDDPEGLRLLAEIARRAGCFDRAEQLLRRSLQLAPAFEIAKRDLDEVIAEQAKADASNALKPDVPPQAAVEFEQAIVAIEHAIQKEPQNEKLWLNYGHALRMAGHAARSTEAYRKAVQLRPGFGEAWWSLADLKLVRLGADDLSTMENALEKLAKGSADSIGIHFAMGKALADQGEFARSFQHYAEGNSARRNQIRYDPDAIEAYVAECEAIFTREFFQQCKDDGAASSDPIFIIGMPRSGSTLVEQILASHSAIEGTEELVYLGNLASVIAGGKKAGLENSSFVQAIASLHADRLKEVAGSYLWNASRHRKSSRPLFIDKMPRNWLYLPLIALALPNARIIEVRRNAMDCCWSNYRQLFADSGEFSYDLAELGRYYRTCTRMIDHFDAALPGRIHRISYEDLLANTEPEVRRALDYLGLPFESQCLEFYRNPRSVKTSSSEQVRQPIHSEGVGQWRPFAPWLGPLQSALGTALEGQERGKDS
jgi:cytochrome c-type biogenesis protein CcmH/NrfG